MIADRLILGSSVQERLPRLQHIPHPLLRLLLRTQLDEPLALELEDVLLADWLRVARLRAAGEDAGLDLGDLRAVRAELALLDHGDDLVLEGVVRRGPGQEELLLRDRVERREAHEGDLLGLGDLLL